VSSSAKTPSPPPGDAQRLLVQQLFVRHQAQVRSYALALTGDFAAAEDVVQETFLTATAKADSFTPNSNFLAWALAIARLKVLENRRASRKFSPPLIDSLIAAQPETSANAPDSRLAALLSCIDELTPKFRELIRLRYFAEHGPGEIAHLLDRTVTGVNTALSKIRERLRECVARKGATGISPAAAPPLAHLPKSPIQ